MSEVGCLKDGSFQNLSVEGEVHKFLSTTSPTDIVLTNSDSGKVIFLDASSSNTVTLPAVSTVSAGWNIKVILTATGALAGGIVQTGNTTENKMLGQIFAIDADGSAIVADYHAAGDTITFANGCLAGAFVDIVSNGSIFYVQGFGTHATAADKITITQET